MSGAQFTYSQFNVNLLYRVGAKPCPHLQYSQFNTISGTCDIQDKWGASATTSTLTTDQTDEIKKVFPKDISAAIFGAWKIWRRNGGMQIFLEKISKNSEFPKTINNKEYQ